MHFQALNIAAAAASLLLTEHFDFLLVAVKHSTLGKLRSSSALFSLSICAGAAGREARTAQQRPSTHSHIQCFQPIVIATAPVNADGVQLICTRKRNRPVYDLSVK